LIAVGGGLTNRFWLMRALTPVVLDRLDPIVGFDCVHIGRSVRRGDPSFTHQNILSLDFKVGNPMLALCNDPSAATR
jgi:hypothetical protein